MKYFFPFATFEPIRPPSVETSTLSLDWLGFRYAFKNRVPFTEHELKMLKSVNTVLTSRYRMLRDADRSALDVERFSGVPEDRYVSAFLDERPYTDETWKRRDPNCRCYRGTAYKCVDHL